MDSSDNFLVIGHRGAMGYVTENTIASVEKAIDLGVSIVEIDVFRIRSGEVVVFHDDRVDDLTNGAGEIEDLYITEVLALTLQGGHKIPKLQDILKAVDGQISLNIELKGANTAAKVNQIINYYSLQQSWNLDQFVISSFRWDELEKMRKLNPEVAIAVLTEKDPLDAICMAHKLGAIAINPWYKNLTQEAVDAIHAKGFKVYTYTVNEVEDIAQMKAMGVDPEMMKKNVEMMKNNPMMREAAKNMMKNMTPEEMRRSSQQAQQQMQGMTKEDLEKLWGKE